MALKWQTQQGIPVIPKTSKKSHMLENVDLFDWTLSNEDMKTLTSAATPTVAGIVEVVPVGILLLTMTT